MMEEEKYFITVSEPWDFESSDGQNIIKGSILSIKSSQCIVFRSNNYLQFDDVKGNILILTQRHYGYDFSNFKNEIIAFNGGVLLGEYNEELSESQLREKTKFVIIGSMRKG
jgi:hypothetical protein